MSGEESDQASDLKQRRDAIPLCEYAGSIRRGMRLRCQGSQPYEPTVDFMVVESWDRTDCGYTLMIASGYKAGLRHVVLPKDSSNRENNGIDADWLRANWASWVYPECSVCDMLVLPEYLPESNSRHDKNV